MHLARLSRYLTTAPKTPGVYVWRDARKGPIYVGKAANLKSRLSSYLKTTDSRIQMMIDQAASLDWQTTDTDIEALILESQMIKGRRPKFNIDLRDDKQYFFVAVTKEDFPQLILTHQSRSTKIKKPIKELIGPFTDGVPLKSTMRILRNLFPYCSCKQKHYLRCLNAHIGKCPGYCCLKRPSTKTQITHYKKNIRAIRDILVGKRASVVRRLITDNPDMAFRVMRVFQNAQINARHARMAAQHHGALEQIRDELHLADEPRRVEGYDIANIQGQHAVGAMVVFTDGRADNQEYRQFNIRIEEGGDTAMLGEMLQRRLGHAEWPLPDLIVVDGGKAQLNAILRALKDADRVIPVVALTKDDRHQGDHVFFSRDTRVRYLTDLPRPVRDLLVHVDSEAHRFSITRYRRKHSAALLK